MSNRGERTSEITGESDEACDLLPRRRPVVERPLSIESSTLRMSDDVHEAGRRLRCELHDVVSNELSGAV